MQLGTKKESVVKQRKIDTILSDVQDLFIIPFPHGRLKNFPCVTWQLANYHGNVQALRYDSGYDSY